MYKISIIEDCLKDQSILCDLICSYGTSNGVEFKIETFTNVEAFLDGYKCDSDIVLMDIELPGMDGMSGAAEFRKLDSKAVLIFTTNMVQFATKGYAVNAMDYLVKPITYDLLSLKLSKAIHLVDSDDDNYINVLYEHCVRRVSLRNLVYVEVRGHRLYYHMSDKTVIDVRGVLDDVERTLKGKNFVRCNSCYLVNLRYVSEISSDTVVVGGDRLQVSRRRKPELLQACKEYFSASGD